METLQIAEPSDLFECQHADWKLKAFHIEIGLKDINCKSMLVIQGIAKWITEDLQIRIKR